MSELPPGFVLDEPSTSALYRVVSGGRAATRLHVDEAPTPQAAAPAEQGGWANLHWPTMPSWRSVLNGIESGGQDIIRTSLSTTRTALALSAWSRMLGGRGRRFDAHAGGAGRHS